VGYFCYWTLFCQMTLVKNHTDQPCVEEDCKQQIW
jgi:hypothetical protein